MKMTNYYHSNFNKTIIFLFMNVQVFISTIGFVGNILAFFVFSRKPLRKQSYSFYWKIMIISDCIVLLHSFRHWANFVLNINIDLFSNILCKINEYQPYVASSVSQWLLVLISIDRLVIILYPNRSRLMKKRYFQAILVAFIIAFSMLINIQLPFNYQLQSIGNGKNSSRIQLVCYLPDNFEVNSNYLVMINFILPNIVINNILDVVLICFITSSRRTVRKRVQINFASVNRDIKFAISSIALNVASSLLKIPFAIGLYASNYFNMSQDQNKMLFIINVTILIIDNSDLFYINMIFNSIFYKEFRNMIRFK